MFYENTDRYAKLTREKFYELVWTTPTVQLAKTYGISDVYIAKLCKKHHVPKPPLGYWARRQHGHKVSSKPLLRINNPELQTIYIPKRPTPDIPIEQPTEVEQKIAFEKSEANRIKVLEHLENPHPSVERTLKSLESARGDEKGIVRPKARGCLDVAVGKSSINRAMKIMDAFLKALESRRYPVSILEGEKGRATIATILEENLAFRLEEAYERKEKPLNRDQKENLAKWGYYFREYDYILTGNLSIRITQGGYDGERKSCSDTKTRRLEDNLNKFMVLLINAAQGSKRDRQEAEERQRKREEDHRRWQEEEERRYREQERVKEFDSLLAAWINCQNIRCFIQAVEQSAAGKGIEIAPESDLSFWISWARKRANALDPIISWIPVFKR